MLKGHGVHDDGGPLDTAFAVRQVAGEATRT